MKLLARTLLIIGGVVLVGAIVLLAYGGFEVWKQFIALSANRSLAFSNPVGVMLGGAALALLAGLFAGYALGMPRQPKQQPHGHPHAAAATTAAALLRAEPLRPDPARRSHVAALKAGTSSSSVVRAATVHP